jgi:TolA-binding protein
MIMDKNGVERVRNEGYLPREEFRAWLENALARLPFLAKEWGEAEKRYANVAANYPNTNAAPEALYWRGVSRYKASQDHTVLGQVARELKEKYPGSIWTTKASIWAE